jgi:cytochrome c peroxidase
LAGKVGLSTQEQEGLELFEGKGQCSNCHSTGAGPNGEPPLFTDFTYDNLGVPRNPDNPWYDMIEFNPDGMDWVDQGLGGFLATTPTDLVPDYSSFAPQNIGKHKVSTLRNVDKRPNRQFVKAYMHNGYFKSLRSVVHFYNTRDVKDRCPNKFTLESEALALNCWPEPEITENVNVNMIGNLGLSESEEEAIVAFMKTLSDGSRKRGGGRRH